MEITRISDPILNTLRDKKFVGDFEVTIYHPNLPCKKIKGYKPNESAFPYDFSCDLKNKINEICFLIVSGVIRDGDFYFSIKGQIEYLYECDGVEQCMTDLDTKEQKKSDSDNSENTKGWCLIDPSDFAKIKRFCKGNISEREVLNLEVFLNDD